MLHHFASWQSRLTRPLREDGERGATAVEYALMGAAIMAIIAAVVFAIGAQTDAFFTDIDTRFP